MIIWRKPAPRWKGRNQGRFLRTNWKVMCMINFRSSAERRLRSWCSLLKNFADSPELPHSSSPAEMPLGRACGQTWIKKGESLEFAARGGLREANVAGGDVGLEVVFALDGGASEAAEHGDLADVIEGVSNRSLKEAFRRSVKRFV